MSFRIFAAGSGGFHYSRDNNIEGSDFDSIKILAILQSMEPTRMGAAGAAAEYVTPSAGITDLMESMATTEFLHNLSNAVSFLAMNSSSNGGWISVSSRVSHVLWTDTAGFAEYRFSPGNEPGSEFIRAINPSLRTTGMNNWGVLRALSTVLALFSNQLSDSTTPMINIQISK